MSPLGSGRLAHEADVVVVGSGLPPLVTALELARRGASVIVARDAVAPQPLALGLMLLGPGRPYAVVAREASRPAAQVAWAAGCENHLRAKALLEALPGGGGYVARGSFLMARGRASAEELEESEDMLSDDGFRGEFLDHYMLETRFDVAGFVAAYWAAEDAELDVAQATASLEQAARGSGAAFELQRAVSLRAEPSGVVVELEQGGSLRGTAGVVATDGPAATLVPELAPLLVPLPGAELTRPLLAGAHLPPAVRTADGRVAWLAEGGSIRLAATGPWPVSDPDPLEAIASFLPLAEASGTPAPAPVVAPASGPGEVSIDGFPLVGRLPDRPLAVACGFGRLSASFAFAAARFVADALLRGADPTPETLRATRKPAARRV